MAFEKLERLVTQQFRCVDEYVYTQSKVRNKEEKKSLESWTVHTKHEILIAAYAILMTQITRHSNSWPYRLPDPGLAAEDARVEAEKLLKLRLHALDESDKLFGRVCLCFEEREEDPKGVAPPSARGDEAAAPSPAPSPARGDEAA